MSGFGKGATHTKEAKEKMRVAALNRKRKSAEERFWEKVDKTPGRGPNGDCWEWKNPSRIIGYGLFLYEGSTIPAHRYSYFLKNGFFPAKGFDVDHLCRNRACVNPDHLESVTHRENARRGDCGWITGAKLRARTHCKNGHEFTEANTYLEPRGYRSIKRRCRACGREIARWCAEKKRRKQNGERNSD